jgi:hypothetical protein
MAGPARHAHVLVAPEPGVDRNEDERAADQPGGG